MKKKVYLVRQGVLRGISREFISQHVVAVFDDYLLAQTYCDVRNRFFSSLGLNFRFTFNDIHDVLPLNPSPYIKVSL